MEIQNITGTDTIPVSKLQDNTTTERETKDQPQVVKEETRATDESKGQTIDTLA